MATIRIEFYNSFQDVDAFDTVEAAKLSVPVAHNPGRYDGYAVLFELDGKYGVYVHSEDRYYSSYLPDNAKPLFGGNWRKGERVVFWKGIGRLSEDERKLLGNTLADLFEDTDS